MPLSSNVHAEGLADILQSVLDAADDDILLVNPTREAIECLVAVATDFEGAFPTIRVVADESILKDVMDDFIVASNAADLIDDGSLYLKANEVGAESALVVTHDVVLSIVTAGDRVAALSTEEADFVTAAFDAYRAEWDDAEEYRLRTPALSRVRETMADDISPAVQADFDDVLASLQTARGNGEGLDEVTISLLVAAKNDVLLYDISKWGEDVGIASKATFSRTKTKLEDLGLIDTEKVPIDVGRPRLRLKLGDERLRSVDANELASVAQSILR
jgi:PHD/YefM family antitoxin component YafN of YafNO toxin-antitoxin module